MCITRYQVLWKGENVIYMYHKDQPNVNLTSYDDKNNKWLTSKKFFDKFRIFMKNIILLPFQNKAFYLNFQNTATVCQICNMNSIYLKKVNRSKQRMISGALEG